MLSFDYMIDVSGTKEVRDGLKIVLVVMLRLLSFVITDEITSHVHIKLELVFIPPLWPPVAPATLVNASI